MFTSRIFLSALFAALCLLQCGSAQKRGSSRRRSEQDILQRILDPNSYDSRVNPGGTDNVDGPVNVTVELYVRDIADLDDSDQELDLQLTLRLRWTDGRLTYSRPSNDLKFVTVQDEQRKVWRPDLFVSNARKEVLHEYTQANSLTRIYPNGTVLSSQRVSLKLACSMNLRKMPFDTQACSIRMASYAYTNDDVVFSWREEHPVRLSDRLNVPLYHVENVETETCDAQTSTGNYSCVQAVFSFKRLTRYYLIQVFIPLTMTTIVSYLAFWLEPQNIIVRVIIGLTTLFVSATGISHMNMHLPNTSYTKLLDTFTGIVLTFIFVTVIETIVVYNLSRGEEDSAGAGDNSSSTNKGNDPEDPETENLKPAESDEVQTEEKQPEENPAKPKKKRFNARHMKSYLARFPRRSARVDAGFRIGFPIVYILFIIVYVVFANI